MKTWISLAVVVMLSACGSTEKNESAGQVPAAMSCPASQDPSQGCPSPSNPAIPLGGEAVTGNSTRTNKAEAAQRMKIKTKTIEGRCELLVQGEKNPRSCSEVKVMVRSLEKGEMRDGVVDGFGVVFPDLNENSYKLLAQSESFDLTTGAEELKPGRKVLLRIKAKPRKP